MSVAITLDDILIPRLTTTERDAITAVNGMFIYNTTLNEFQGYENSAWVNAVGDALTADITVDSVTLDVANADVVLNRAAAGALGVETALDTISQEILRLKSTRATRAPGDEIYLGFFQPTSTGVSYEFARITSIASTVTNGAEEAALQFECASQFNGQGLIEYLRLDALAGEVLINGTLESIDFRVAGNIETDLIRTVAASDIVGIGGTPIANQGTLQVEEDTDAADLELLRFRSVRATRAVGDSVYMTVFMPTTDGTQEEFGRLTFEIISVTDAAETGALDITLPDAGVARRVWRFEPNNTVFAPDSDDINFVLQSVGNSMAFEMDSGRNTVGIGEGANTDVQLSILNPLTDSPSVEMIRIASGRTTKDDNDEIYISFLQPTDTGVQAETGRFTWIATDVSNTNKSSALEIHAYQSNANIRIARWFATAGVNVSQWDFNPDSVDMDFQFQGNNEAQLFVIDGGLDVIAMGTVGTSGVMLTMEQDANTPAVEMIRLRSTRSTRADNDELSITFYMPSSNGTQDEWGVITVYASDITTGVDADSVFQIETLGAGAKTLTFRAGHDASGVLQFGFGSLLAVRQTYTVTNDATDRTYDANLTSLDELADVLGTLIADLQLHGIVL